MTINSNDLSNQPERFWELGIFPNYPINIMPGCLRILINYHHFKQGLQRGNFHPSSSPDIKT